MSLDMYLDEVAKGECGNFIRYLNEGNNGEPLVELNFAGKLAYRKDKLELVRILCHILQTNTSIKVLNLADNDIGPEGFLYLRETLKHNKTVEEVYLWNNEAGPEGIKYLSEGLRSNPSVKILDLENNNIDSEGAEHLSEMLKCNTSITKINIGWNQVGDKGARHMSEALKSNRYLKKLDLWDNQIHSDGTAYIACALKVNSTLTELGLGDNKLGPESARNISEALKANTTLKNLGLEASRVDINGALALSEALKVNRTLKMLSMWDNQIEDNGAKALLQAIASNNQIEEIDFRANNVREDVVSNTRAIISFLNEECPKIGTVKSDVTSILPQPLYEEILTEFVSIPKSSEIAKIVYDFMPETCVLGEPLARNETERAQQRRNLIEALNTPRPLYSQFSSAISSQKRLSSGKDSSAKRKRISKHEVERVNADSQEYFKNQGYPKAKRK